MEPAPDLDGDGDGDVLLSLRRDAAFVAFSGKSGAMLWKYFAGADGEPGSTAGESDCPLLLSVDNSIAGEPAMADVNRDGTPDSDRHIDFLRARHSATAHAGGNLGPVRHVALVLSGR